MKTLYLVRHAEATPGGPTLPDHDRPLNENGLREVITMGQRLAQRGVKPALLLASTATRALGTAERLGQLLGIERKDIVVNDRLYNASANELLGVVAELGAQPQSVMLVAHNPGLADLAHHFASEISHMPTCAVVELSFAIAAWGDVGEAGPTKAEFDRPKNV